MTETFLKFTGDSRIMVLAPHPDDEAIATGGLLQQAASAGAAVRVIFVTNGDNNAWPQRVFERRWRITPADRARWGQRRRAETISSLACLGIPAENAVFWGYPDLGLTELLMKESDMVLNRLVREILLWRPTDFIAPSALDLHPDHSAISVLAHCAVARIGRPVELIEYLVHSYRRPSARSGLARRYAGEIGHLFRASPPPRYGENSFTLPLSPEQRESKAGALDCHATQLKLSRRRLFAAASGAESFMLPGEPRKYEKAHPVRCSIQTENTWEISLNLAPRRGRLGSALLHIATDHPAACAGRYTIAVPERTGPADVHDMITGDVVARADYRGSRIQGTIALPLAALQPMRKAFIKLEQQYLFFDQAGWREVPVNERAGNAIAMPAAGANQGRCAPAVCCVVPCYNVACFCGETVREAAAHADHVIAVDDGSGDETASVLASIARELPGRITVLSYPVNRGKGFALLEGFRHALDNIPFDVLVTLDSDLQHRPADIPRLVEACLRDGADMAIGVRVKSLEHIPLRSLLGNRLMSGLMRLSYPHIPDDTQSGFRALSRNFVRELTRRLRGGRYETELEMLLLALEQDRRLTTAPIPVIYLGSNRSSHFQPLADAARIYKTFCSFRAHHAPA